MNENGETRWWWIRHAPVPGPSMLHDRDAPPDLDDDRRIRRLRRLLPAGAVWVTSDMRRAWQTAAVLSDAPVARVPDLAEQDFGAWTGRLHDDLWADADTEYRQFWEAPADSTPPEGESFVAMCLRVAATVERLTDQHHGCDLVAVAHAGTVRAALALALGLAPERALQFVIEPWSITRIDRVASSWRVSRVNG